MSKLLIAYGTLTFNTETVMQEVSEFVKAKNSFAEVEMINVYEIIDTSFLEAYESFIFATSSWGEGDPPPDTDGFLERILANPPNLASKKALMIGLGETEYEHFCGGAERFVEVMKDNTSLKFVDEIYKIDGYPEYEIIEATLGWVEKNISTLQ